MSRSNARSGERGLPSAPRSRSVPRPRQDDSLRSSGRERSRGRDYSRERSRDRDAPPRQVRSQRSIAAIPDSRDRSRAPPVPDLPSSMRSTARTRDPYNHRTKTSDASSVSSSGSSLLDRMRRPGDTSSRTSLEEDYDEPPKRGRGGARGGSLRSKRVVEEKRSKYDDEDSGDAKSPKSASSPYEAYGASIWNAVSSFSNNLTVNINKAWETNVTEYDGEATPAGEESRLTRAMKAYHLSKARSPEDLPEWLFDEHERRPGRSRRAVRHEEDDDDFDVRSDYAAPPRSRGLRDIYEAAAPSKSPPPPRSQSAASNRRGFEESSGPSKATNRLKELRDAKRSAHNVNRSFDDRRAVSEAGFDPAEEAERRPSLGDRRRAPKVGLPSAPSRGGRF